MSRFSRASLWKDLEQALPPDLRASRTVKAAFDIAYEAHDGQFRAERDPGRSRIPYIVHPVGVAKLAIAHWREGELDAEPAAVISAALLHDVLEDSSFEYGDLAQRTSPEIADLVRQLTKPPVLAGMEKSERNRSFAAQIAAAGPAAVYVKICDALHNLSRPNGMPTTLLQKSVAKAERTYLPLLDRKPFEVRMAAMLRAAIASCKEVGAQRAQEEREFDPFDFASVITHIEQASGVKLLELHDLVDILAQIPGVSHALYGAPGELAAAICAVYPELGFDFWNGVAGGAPGIRRLPGASAPKSSQLPFTHLLRLEEGIYGRSDRSHGILLAYSEGAIPSWFRPETVAAIVQVSTGKIDRHMHDVLLAVQALARKHGVEIDLEATRKHSIGEQDILAYVHARDVGQIFLSQIVYFVEEIARTRPEWQLQIQSRVKSFVSLLEKGVRHGRRLSNEVEDFLGLRLICMSANEAQALSQSMSKVIADGAHFLSQAVEVRDPRVRRVDSTSGYKAIHVVFELEGVALVRGRLGCEIQIRTIFEHAWAQVSESIRYKHRVSGRQVIDKQLRALADRRDELEAVVALLSAHIPP